MNYYKVENAERFLKLGHLIYINKERFCREKLQKKINWEKMSVNVLKFAGDLIVTVW